MARITIKRSVFNKLMTQLNKDKNADCKAALAKVHKTQNPKMDTILWDPEPEALKLMIEVLENELSFIRKKESTSFKEMTDTIETLRRALPS
jgi:hypothetical protein